MSCGRDTDREISTGRMRPGPLSEFGTEQVRRFSERYAEQVGSNHSRWAVWRYYATIPVAFIQLGSAISATLNFGTFIWSRDPQFLVSSGWSLAALVVTGLLHAWLLPPVVADLE